MSVWDDELEANSSNSYIIFFAINHLVSGV